MNYLIYTRVSPKGSNFEGDTSVGMQETICREFVASRQGTVAGVICDELISGKNTNRPGIQEIFHQIEAGAAWDALCVYKLDRLTRSHLDQLVIFKKFGDANKGIVSATEPLFDYSTPIGRFQLSQIAAVNQYYREVNAENTRNKMISIAANGGWAPGSAPLGYRRDGHKNNVLAVDERGAVKVRAIFEMYADDRYTSQDICRKFKINVQQVLNILRNPIYLGMIRYAGKVYPGKHPAIIPAELFEKVKNKLPQNKYATRPKAAKYDYLLGGLVRCHCGRYMTQTAAKGGSFHYYRCTDTNCRYAVSARKLEQAVIATLQNAEFSEQFIEKIIAEIERRRKVFIDEAMPETQQLWLAVARARTERENLYQKFINSNLSPEKMVFLSERMDALSAEIKDNQARLDFIQSERRNDVDIYEEMKQVAAQLQDFKTTLNRYPSDRAIQRQAIIFNIKTITALPPATQKGAFLTTFNYSSYNPKIWLPRKDLNLD